MDKLLADINEFLKLTGIGDYQFGIRAVRNGRLMERLRSGKRVWPETEAQIRGFMVAERARINEARKEWAA